MIGIVFNHDMFDEPYNQNAVKKWLNSLDVFGQALHEKMFYSFGNKRVFFLDANLEDEYVIVQHTCAFTMEQKEELANIIKNVLTLKKSIYKKELPSMLIVFEKKNEEDCFCF